jgi:hypothetical protein
MSTLVDRLAELKILQRQRSDASPFSSLVDFQVWADQVAPLLSFNPKLQSAFKHTVTSATVTHRLGSENDAFGSFNECIGLTNQAIRELELQRAEAVAKNMEIAVTKPIQAPEKLTLKWLYEHAPVSFYFWLFGFASVAVAVGFTASEMRTAMYSNNFKANEPSITQPTNASTPTIATKAASSVTAITKR